jgi:HK97 family phage prohead protease
MSFTSSLVPDVSSLHPACNGEGLLISGYAATFDLDKVNDKINPYALDKTVARFMATNPVLLYFHKLGVPPVGKILQAVVHRKRGLWVEAILPKPDSNNSLGHEVWEAVKNGLMRALSVGGRFFRNDKGSFNEVHGMRLDEVSICPVSVGFDTVADSVKPTHVKSLGGVYVPVAHYAEYKALMDQRDDLAWLHGQLQRRADLDAIDTMICRARLGVRSR